MEEQAGVARLIQLTQGGGAQPGKATMGLVVEPVRENRYLCRWQDPPSLPKLLAYYGLKVCSTYLKTVVRIDTAPAALL